MTFSPTTRLASASTWQPLYEMLVISAATSRPPGTLTEPLKLTPFRAPCRAFQSIGSRSTHAHFHLSTLPA